MNMTFFFAVLAAYVVGVAAILANSYFIPDSYVAVRSRMLLWRYVTVVVLGLFYAFAGMALSSSTGQQVLAQLK